MTEKSKTVETAEKMQKIGKALTFGLTVPILGLLFFGIIGLAVGVIVGGAIALGIITQTEEVSESQDEAIPDQIRDLSTLKDEGVLSEEQFETKKAELLKKI